MPYHLQAEKVAKKSKAAANAAEESAEAPIVPHVDAVKPAGRSRRLPKAAAAAADAISDDAEDTTKEASEDASGHCSRPKATIDKSKAAGKGRGRDSSLK